MRLRTTAVALAGALTLVLPTAAQALADDGRAFNYSFLQDGVSRSGQVSDLTEDKCHALAVTDDASIEEAVNETDKVALLFDNKRCEGEPVLAAGPGEKAGDFEAVAVVFEAAESGEQREEGKQREEGEQREEATPGQAPADSASDESYEDEEPYKSAFRMLG
ncbi:hypothetical protein AB0D45_29905 [Streptomyces sp. NPDC048352]|uniref:hypothetical protein n=1 Tax=Streptomyces sp. NPDC048352 TaxID=3154718 RepID=UPI00344AF832